MIGFNRPIADNPLLRSYGGADLPVTLRDTLRPLFRDDPTIQPSDLIETQREVQRERGEDLFGAPLHDVEPEELSPMLSLEELQARYPDLPGVFDAPERQGAADLLAEQKRREIVLQDLLARGPQGIGALAAQFGTMLGAAALDPINIGAAFVPVVSQARYAAWIARLGRTRARLSVGAVEGTVGGALVEPLTYGLSQAQMLDYEMSDALLNVGLSATLGAGLRAGGGALADVAERARLRADENALRTAVSQAVTGRSVDVLPVLTAPESLRVAQLRSSTSPIALGAGRDAPGATVELQGAARATELSPAGAVGDGLVVPSVNRQGGLRVYDTERQAQAAVRRMQGDPVSVTETPEGRFAITRQRPEAEISRRPDGTVRRFPNRRRAQRFIDQTQAGDPSMQAVSVGGGEFAVVRGLSDHDVTAIEANPGLAQFPDRPRDPFTAAIQAQTRPMTADQLVRRAAAEAAPERDAAADFPSARAITEELERRPVATTSESAQAEADLAEELVSQLRERGVLSEADERLVGELDEVVRQSDAWGRAARQAAVCMTRV